MPPAGIGAAGTTARGTEAGPVPTPAGTPEKVARPRSLEVADLVTASILVGLGVLVLRDAVRMGIGWGSDGPQGGFVPFWLATVLVGCSALTVVRAARRRAGKVFVRRDQLARVLAVLLPAAGMIVATPWLGIYVASALYMALYMRWAGRYLWPISRALPVAFTLLVFLVFERWFLVPLPKGPLEAWLGY
jgi:hypothetical protein